MERPTRSVRHTPEQEKMSDNENHKKKKEKRDNMAQFNKIGEDGEKEPEDRRTTNKQETCADIEKTLMKIGMSCSAGVPWLLHTCRKYFF